jgi:hypothetical protein
VIGLIKAEIPRINARLHMFEPTIFPSAISELPRNADVVDTINSGAEVPKATIVRPITRGESDNLNAIAVEPRTNKSPPRMSMARPTINNVIVRIITIPGLYFQ